MPKLQRLCALLGPQALLIACRKRTKQPTTKWRHLTIADMSDSAHLSRLNRATNIGVVLGRVSGGLCSIDIDDDKLVEPFLKRNPVLRDTLRTKGQRGCNLWIRIEGEYPRTHHIKQDGATIGEFRSDGSYTIISGQHPSGCQYQFIKEARPREISFNQLQFPADTRTERTERTERTKRTERTQRTKENGRGMCLGDVNLKKILLMAKPNREHTNHHCLFLLARGVLALEAERGKCYSRAELRDVFNQWYAAAKPYVRENQISDDYLMEFLELYNYVGTPLGSDVVDVAWKLAQSEPPPPEAEQFDSLEYKQLTALCWHLQQLAKAEPFYLSTRTVQRLCGLETHAQAARRLRGLVRFGVLKEIEKGGPHTNKATRFRYVKKKTT